MWVWAVRGGDTWAATGSELGPSADFGKKSNWLNSQLSSYFSGLVGFDGAILCFVNKGDGKGEGGLERCEEERIAMCTVFTCSTRLLLKKRVTMKIAPSHRKKGGKSRIYKYITNKKKREEMKGLQIKTESVQLGGFQDLLIRLISRVTMTTKRVCQA